MFKGELISIGVALSWTVTALFAEVASKRIGSLPLNVCRMALSLALLAGFLWLTFGVPYPRYADGGTWLWLLLSGVVGYVLGDYCLFKGYILIGSRFGQLFMTLSAPTAAVTGYLLLGERMRPLALLGMAVTLVGIGMSVLSKQTHKEECKPFRELMDSGSTPNSFLTSSFVRLNALSGTFSSWTIPYFL